MKTKSGLSRLTINSMAITGMAIAGLILSLGACSPSSDTAANETPEAPAVETAEQTVARLSSLLSPQDFKRREIECLETNAAAKRTGEHRLPAELAALVAAEPRMDFLALGREARDLGLTSEDIGNAQSSALRAPDSPEEMTPEYETHLRDCLAISQVANVRHGVAS